MCGCWGHAWLWGGGGHVHLLKGGMCSCQGGVHGCQGACMVGGVHVVAGACMVAGGPAWLWGVNGCWGACVVARGHAWLWGEGHAWWPGGAWYASYWNTFLFAIKISIFNNKSGN